MNEAAAYYLDQLRNGDADNAFHALCEMGAAILPDLIAEARAESDPLDKARIIHVIWEIRDPSCLPFLVEALQHSHEDVWKVALHGIVAIGGGEARDGLTAQLALERKRVTPSAVKIDWFEEALEQVVFSGRPTSTTLSPSSTL